ncbi:MAG: SAM-dependent chlorinase/fluorinase [Sediminibacterium sp.]|nr:SAM-dependent chlorinase/fluorinase [Sediminibacterium sp.]
MASYTICSDLGLNNVLVAIIKSKLHNHFTNIYLGVDICHELPQSLSESAYIVKQAIVHFSADSIHFIFRQYQKKYVLFYRFEQILIVPDDGFCTMLFDDNPQAVYQIETSHCKDLLACVDSIIQVFKTTHNNLIKILSNLHPTLDYIKKYPKKMGGFNRTMIEIDLLHIGNNDQVILNITKEDFYNFVSNKPFEIEITPKTKITKIVTDPYSVNDYELNAWFNTAQYLELFMKIGQPAQLFNFGQPNERYNGSASPFKNLKIKIRILSQTELPNLHVTEIES